jgi:hypothetical protein
MGFHYTRPRFRDCSNLATSPISLPSLIFHSHNGVSWKVRAYEPIPSSLIYFAKYHFSMVPLTPRSASKVRGVGSTGAKLYMPCIVVSDPKEPCVSCVVGTGIKPIPNTNYHYYTTPYHHQHKDKQTPQFLFLWFPWHAEKGTEFCLQCKKKIRRARD